MAGPGLGAEGASQVSLTLSRPKNDRMTPPALPIWVFVSGLILTALPWWLMVRGTASESGLCWPSSSLEESCECVRDVGN